jgi:hypothetical protein
VHHLRHLQRHPAEPDAAHCQVRLHRQHHHGDAHGHFLPVHTGSEFQLSGAASGTITYTYTPTGQDPLIQYVAVKGGNDFNLFAVGGAGTDTVFAPLNNQGNPREVSHISFYDTSLLPVTVPEPMSLALFGAGLLGLGVARRARRQA